MTVRLVTARIWFWQAGAARRAGWYVRRPNNDTGKLRWFDAFRSLRLTIARYWRFEDVGVAGRVSDRGTGNVPPVRVDLGIGLWKFEAAGAFDRALNDLIVPRLPIGAAVDDLQAAFLGKHGEPVEHGDNGRRVLSINQYLNLLGHPQSDHPSISDVLIRHMEARRQIARESGARI